MIWWLAFEKKSFHFWRDIWIQVVFTLLQLYQFDPMYLTVFYPGTRTSAHFKSEILQLDVFEKQVYEQSLDKRNPRWVLQDAHGS